MQRELFRPALIFPGRRWERQPNYLSHNDISSDGYYVKISQRLKNTKINLDSFWLHCYNHCFGLTSARQHVILHL